MHEAMINIKNLSCKVGNHYLLNQINWQVNPGEQWIVFGLNGSGKTTLLSIIAGFRKYNSGEVVLFGNSLEKGDIIQKRQRIGWVSSSFFDSYYKNESALAIILAGKTGTLGLSYSLTEGDVCEAKRLLKTFGLEHKSDMPFNTFSKGERQNILLIRALLAAPDILVLDEPCSGLDIVARERVLSYVKKIIDEKKMSVIYVTHYAEEILSGFTHGMFLKNGKPFMKGPLLECLTQERMSEFLEASISLNWDEQGRLQIRFDKEEGSVKQ